jgi:iron complex transport system permease protein
MEKILFNVRLPRIMLACLIGCCLSAAGASYQGIFRNPMAAPDILGATSGAAFGAALAIINEGNNLTITAYAFGFSLLTVGIVYLISKKAQGNKVLGLVLCGIIVSSLFTAGTSYLKLVADPNDELQEITYWLMGSLSGATNKTVLMAFIPMAIGLIPIFLLRWRINVLTLGDEEARTMGINASRLRLIFIVCATLVTAASVSGSGMIGWVGLVIPHLSRMLVGNNYKYLMPATMLFGAIFMLIVDNVSRNLLQTEIPIGILMFYRRVLCLSYYKKKGGLLSIK